MRQGRRWTTARGGTRHGMCPTVIGVAALSKPWRAGVRAGRNGRRLGRRSEVMRKSIIQQATPGAGGDPEGGWLDLARLARVEVTSEDPAYPIEWALVPGAGSGWRAAEPGPQVIRLRFDVPR